MNESQNNKKKKRNNITQSQLAFVFAVLATLCIFVLLKSPVQPAVGASGFCILFSMAAFILGLISLSSKRNQSSKIEKALGIMSVAISSIILVWMFWPKG